MSTAPLTTDPLTIKWTPLGKERIWECLCCLGGMAGGLFSGPVSGVLDELWQLVCGPFGDEGTLVWWLQAVITKKTL